MALFAGEVALFAGDVALFAGEMAHLEYLKAVSQCVNELSY